MGEETNTATKKLNIFYFLFFMVISKNSVENENLLMNSENSRGVIFDTVLGKSLYEVCVKVINKE